MTLRITGGHPFGHGLPVLLAVTYHYVAVAPSDRARAIFPVTLASLAEQVAVLGRSFEFVTGDDLLAAVNRGRDLPERACIITFDDGLRSQVELALPLLERARVPAVFFVCTAPLTEGRALPVHKTHFLRELWSEEEFETRLRDELERRSIGGDVDAVRSVAHYRYDTPAAARVKYLLNVVLPPVQSEEVVDTLLASSGCAESELVSDLYMDGAQIQELAQRNAVGSHTHIHRPLAQLSAQTIALELGRSAEILAQLTGARPRLISYPYGSPETVDPQVIAQAAQAGYVAGFTTERAVNLTLQTPLALARIDTNDAPGGRRPLLRITDGTLVPSAGLTIGRRRYVVEGIAVGDSGP